MKKGIVLLALLISISLSLLGCNNDNMETDYGGSGEAIKDDSINLVLDGEITKVSIYKLKNSDATVLDFSGTLKDKEALEILAYIQVLYSQL